MKSAIVYAAIGGGLVWGSVVVAQTVQHVTVITATTFTGLLMSGLCFLIVAASEVQDHWSK
jgi:hypothetical protein